MIWSSAVTTLSQQGNRQLSAAVWGLGRLDGGPAVKGGLCCSAVGIVAGQPTQHRRGRRLDGRAARWVADYRGGVSIRPECPPLPGV